MDKKLYQKECISCGGGVSRISRNEAVKQLRNLNNWRLSADKNSIMVEWTMKDFAAAIMLIDRIARLAEKENHHPDIHLTGYRKLEVELTTHSIGGLSKNDFILAAQISRLPKTLKTTKMQTKEQQTKECGLR